MHSRAMSPSCCVRIGFLHQKTLGSGDSFYYLAVELKNHLLVCRLRLVDCDDDLVCIGNCCLVIGERTLCVVALCYCSQIYY